MDDYRLQGSEHCHLLNDFDSTFLELPNSKDIVWQENRDKHFVFFYFIDVLNYFINFGNLVSCKGLSNFLLFKIKNYNLTFITAKIYPAIFGFEDTITSFL